MMTHGITFKDSQGREIDPKQGLSGIPLAYIEHLEKNLDKHNAFVQSCVINFRLTTEQRLHKALTQAVEELRMFGAKEFELEEYLEVLREPDPKEVPSLSVSPGILHQIDERFGTELLHKEGLSGLEVLRIYQECVNKVLGGVDPAT